MFTFKRKLSKKNKVNQVISMLSGLSEKKLKYWFELSDSNVQLRNPDKEDLRLHRELEEELNRRGFIFF